MITSTRRASPAVLPDSPCRRRGIMLLVVLALLSLVALLGITFTSFSKQAEESSIQLTGAVRRQPTIDALMDYAIGQLINDTDQPLSAIRGHSLMRDMYGNDAARSFPPGSYNNQPFTNAFNGTGHTRISSRAALLPALGSDYANFVYNLGSANSYAVARGIVPTALYNPVLGPDDPEFLADFGAADESYDAVDNQNWFLAGVTADGTVTIPSFYRPWLVGDPPGQPGGSGALPDPFDWDGSKPAPGGVPNPFAPGAGNPKVLRPRPIDMARDARGNCLFPMFRASSGSAAPTRPLTYPEMPGVPNWDVDNDGDGQTDSIWVDLGYPVLQDPDGTKVKPLFAFLVQGLNGKIDLNTAGNWVAVANPNPPPTLVYQHRSQLGMSPTEVNPNPPGIVPPVFVGGDEYGRLLFGTTDPARGALDGSGIPGKWGVKDAARRANEGYNRANATVDPLVGPGISRVYPPAPGGLPDGVLSPADDDGDSLEGDGFVYPIDPAGGGQIAYNGMISPTDPRYSPLPADGTMVFSNIATYATPSSNCANYHMTSPLPPATPTAVAANANNPRYAYYHSRVFQNPGAVPGPTIASNILDRNTDEADELVVYDRLRDPYPLSAYGTGPSYPALFADTPFRVTDLETLYRSADPDSCRLPGRLFQLAASLDPASAVQRQEPLPTSLSFLGSLGPYPAPAPAPSSRSRLFTTESWDLITYGSSYDPKWPVAAPEVIAPDGTVSRQGNSYLFPWDALAAATPNRLIDRARSTEGSGVNPYYNIQILADLAAGRRLNVNRPLTPYPAPNDPDPAARRAQAWRDRQSLARDLYLLLRRVTAAAVDSEPPVTARDLAQFAVNCVDYRDGDDVITRFYYVPYETPGAAGPPNVPDLLNHPWNPTAANYVDGVEYCPIAINEVLAYSDSPSVQGQPSTTRAWVELLNTLSENSHNTDAGNVPHPIRSTIDLDDTNAGNPQGGAYRLFVSTDGDTLKPDGQSQYLTFAAASGPTRINGQQVVVVEDHGSPPGGVLNTKDSQNPSLVYTSGGREFGNVAPNDFIVLQRLMNVHQPRNAQAAAANTPDFNDYVTVDRFRVLDVPIFGTPTSDGVDYNYADRVSLERVRPYDANNINYYSNNYKMKRIDAAGNPAPKDTLGGPTVGLPPMDPDTHQTVSTYHSLGQKIPLSVQDPSSAGAYVPLLGSDPGVPMIALNQSTPDARRTSAQGRPTGTYTVLVYPFSPWIHADRDFVSPAELLLVPALPHPSALTNTRVVTENFRETPLPLVGPVTNPNFGLSGIGAGLMAGNVNPLVTASNPLDSAPPYWANLTKWYRLLEFIDVPSRMGGAGGGVNSYSRDSNGVIAGENRAVRVPGKINLNLVLDDPVYAALTDLPPWSTAALFPSLQTVLDSMKPNPAGDTWPMSGDVGPPPPPLQYPDYYATLTPPYVFRGQAAMNVGSTLFRSAQPSRGDGLPMFLAGPSAPGSFQQRQYQSSYFEYQMLEKLANLTTARTSTFAVWVTVGFFEVVDDRPKTIPGSMPPMPAPPRLGREVGILTGQNVRHRAFFIIDRSRAAGWDPVRKQALGWDPIHRDYYPMNLSELILLRSIIE